MATTDDSLVDTPQGRVRGFVLDGVHTFRGVPYAAAPVGDLRFAHSAAPAAWDHERDATGWGAVSIQDVDLLSHVIPQTRANFYPGDVSFSEDCLTANIWSPDPRGSAPVVMWIHGGGWSTGSASSSWSDGAALARRHGVVVVGVNYRLGVLGGLAVDYIDDPAANGLNNRGIHDQIRALEWIRDTIAAYGGDPANVTIAGESAGAFSIAAIMTIPRADGLFRNAIMQSGHGGLFVTETAAAATTAEFLRLVGVEPGPGALERLRAIDVNSIQQARRSLSTRLLAPVVDGITVPDFPLQALGNGASSSVHLMIGMNADEARSFRLLPQRGIDVDVDPREELLSRHDPDTVDTVIDRYAEARPADTAIQAWDAMTNDRDWRVPTYAIADARAQAGAPTYLYEFFWRNDTLGGSTGSHMAEIPFVFDNLSGAGTEGVLGEGVAFDPDAIALADEMSEAWAGFAALGVPFPDDASKWPPYEVGSRTTYIFDRRGGAVADYRRDYIELWSRIAIEGEQR